MKKWDRVLAFPMASASLIDWARISNRNGVKKAHTTVLVIKRNNNFIMSFVSYQLLKFNVKLKTNLKRPDENLKSYMLLSIEMELLHELCAEAIIGAFEQSWNE